MGVDERLSALELPVSELECLIVLLGHSAVWEGNAVVFVLSYNVVRLGRITPLL